jgi:hypothetical protein
LLATRVVASDTDDTDMDLSDSVPDICSEISRDRKLAIDMDPCSSLLMIGCSIDSEKASRQDTSQYVNRGMGKWICRSTMTVSDHNLVDQNKNVRDKDISQDENHDRNQVCYRPRSEPLDVRDENRDRHND